MNRPKKPRSSAPYVFDVYRDGPQWRWRLWAKNGKIVANGGESFKRVKSVTYLIHKLMPAAPVFIDGISQINTPEKATPYEQN